MPRLVRDRATWLAYLALGFYVYVINGIGPSLPGLQADLGLGYTEMSLHGTVFAFGFILVGLTADRTVRRIGRRRALWLGVLGAESGALLLAAAPSLAVSLPAMFVIGGIGGLLIVVTPAILADRHGQDRGRAFGEANAIASAAAALAPLLIGVSIAAGASWRLGFVLPPGLVAAAIAATFAGALVDTTELRRLGGLDRAEGVASLPDVPGSSLRLDPEHAPPAGHGLPRAFWGRWLTLVLVVAVEWCFVYWIAAYMVAAIGVDPATAASSVAPFLVGMVVGRTVGARLAAHRRPETLLLGGLGLTAVGFGLFWTAVGVGPALVGLGAAGLGVAMLYPMALELAMQAAPGVTDLATTRAALGSGIAIASGPFVLGALADTLGLGAAYLVVPLLVVLAAANVLRIDGRRRGLDHRG